MFRQICCRRCVVTQITPRRCVGNTIIVDVFYCKMPFLRDSAKKIQHECLDYICVYKSNRHNLSRMFHHSQAYGARRQYTEPNILHPERRRMPHFLDRTPLVPETPFELGPYGPGGRFYNMPTPQHRYDSMNHGVLPEHNWSNPQAFHGTASHHNHLHRMPHDATPVINHTHEEIQKMLRIGLITKQESFVLLDETQSNKAQRTNLLVTMKNMYKINEQQFRHMANYV